ncbi:hypothetical protein LAUMK13_04921 [Mycobacterium innocens]|uniref:Uncharacterized protein n=1 Tax=Mycobacterium innocens TaxID=2341083 RepID=A0A498QKZ4_9MYCO|nr:hypothetical protein LAUMK13_04921 [Mycobacterium innocens]
MYTQQGGEADELTTPLGEAEPAELLNPPVLRCSHACGARAPSSATARANRA